MRDRGQITDEVEVEVTVGDEPDGDAAELIDNTSNPADLPFGHKPDEVKGPDPAEHPGC